MKNKQVGFKENQIELLQMTNIVIKIKKFSGKRKYLIKER